MRVVMAIPILHLDVKYLFKDKLTLVLLYIRPAGQGLSSDVT